MMSEIVRLRITEEVSIELSHGIGPVAVYCGILQYHRNHGMDQVHSHSIIFIRLGCLFQRSSEQLVIPDGYRT